MSDLSPLPDQIWVIADYVNSDNPDEAANVQRDLGVNTVPLHEHRIQWNVNTCTCTLIRLFDCTHVCIIILSHWDTSTPFYRNLLMCLKIAE